MRGFLKVIFILIWLVWLGGCTAPKLHKDLNAYPKRIVSLSPSITEILFALGLEEKIVGVTIYCNYPDKAKTKPKIGGYTTPNLEKIISLNPDLVIASEKTPINLIKRLNQLKIKTLQIQPKNIKEVYESILKIGKETDSLKSAEKLVFELRKRQKAIVEKTSRALKKVRVFWEVASSSQLITVGKGTFANDIICMAGGINIAEDAPCSYPRYSPELVIQKDPEVIILTCMGDDLIKIEDVRNRYCWRNVSAVRNNRIYIIDQNIATRAGPRIVDALEQVAKALHPELFGD